MKLTTIDPNYCATVVKIDKLFPLENCDNLMGFSVFGYTAIVSKDTKPGTIGVVFTAETQLSDEYCKANNMYREPTLNKDVTQKGYIENNRRVRAMKLRGNISSALFMPIVSLSYIDKGIDRVDMSNFKIGDTFNEINGQLLCEKYFVPTKQIQGSNRIRGKDKSFVKIDNKTFPEHRDTENYFRNCHKYLPCDTVSVSQKLHGSSGRFGYVKCKKKLNRIHRIAKAIGISVDETEYDYIYGSRRVIKNGLAVGYYASDIWLDVMNKYKSAMPKDYIFYGEVIGRTKGGGAIQKDYTYDVPKGECELYIYRISIVNEDGVSVDLPLAHVEQFCTAHGLHHVPILWQGFHADFKPEDWIDKTFHPKFTRAVPLHKNSPCDEGVVVRSENLIPYATKIKSPIFLQKETKDLDEGIVDTESLESNEPPQSP